MESAEILALKAANEALVARGAVLEAGVNVGGWSEIEIGEENCCSEGPRKALAHRRRRRRPAGPQDRRGHAGAVPRLRGGAPLKRYSSAAAAAAVALSAALTLQLVCVGAQPPPGEPGDGGALGASSGCGAPGDDPAECAALSDFAAALNYKGWKKARAWRTAASICTWHGVTCAGGRVVGLSLGDNNLKGSLPASLGDLSRLTTLVLDGQQPPSYSGCSSTDLQYSALPPSF